MDSCFLPSMRPLVGRCTNTIAGSQNFAGFDTQNTRKKINKNVGAVLDFIRSVPKRVRIRLDTLSETDRRSQDEICPIRSIFYPIRSILYLISSTFFRVV